MVWNTYASAATRETTARREMIDNFIVPKCKIWARTGKVRSLDNGDYHLEPSHFYSWTLRWWTAKFCILLGAHNAPYLLAASGRRQCLNSWTTFVNIFRDGHPRTIDGFEAWGSKNNWYPRPCCDIVDQRSLAPSFCIPINLFHVPL
jgi:hypothetical protein